MFVKNTVVVLYLFQEVLVQNKSLLRRNIFSMGTDKVLVGDTWVELVQLRSADVPREEKQLLVLFPSK